MTKQDCINLLLPYAEPIIYVPRDPFSVCSEAVAQGSHSGFEQAVAQALLYLLGHENGLIP